MKQTLKPQQTPQARPLLSLHTVLGIFITGNIILAAFIHFNSEVDSLNGLSRSDTLEVHEPTFSLGRGVMISVDDFTRNFNSALHADQELEDFSFDITSRGMSLNLTWSFPKPTEYLYSEIERSEDMVYWENIGHPNCGSDNSGRIGCDFSDIQPFMGNSYYRIRFIDENNNIIYSQVKAVNSGMQTEKFFSITFPFNNDILTINTLSDQRREATIAVFDDHGEVLWRMDALLHRGKNNIGLNINQLRGKKYFIGFYSEDEYQISHFDLNEV